MKRIFLSLAFIGVIAIPAMAQQTPSTPLDQALSGKLMDEINQNIQLRAQLVQAQEQIKTLQAKPDPKPASKPVEPKK